MSEFGDFKYPFADFAGPDATEACGCRYACFPQFGARFEAVHNTRDKLAGFPEFGDVPSDPPRRFLRKRTTYRCYEENHVPVATFWEQTDVDPVTGDATTTYSDPDFVGCPYASFSGSPTGTVVSPTGRKSVWENFSGDFVASRLVQLEVLEKEYTTEQLQSITIDELPPWSSDEDFPGENVPDGVAGVAGFVSSGICYSEGQALWSPDDEGRVLAPSVWRLADNEITFFVQRVRYRIVFPHRIGVIPFNVEWKERFVPDGGGDPELGAAVPYESDGTQDETETFQINERQENGEVFICCARIASA